MRDWRAQVREADGARPVDMPPDRVEHVRQVVIAAARQPQRETGTPLVRSWAFVAAMAVVAAAGAAASWQAGMQEQPVPIKAVQNAGERVTVVDEAAERQQLHFSTPGGTRIIWVFDSQFDSKGTLP